MAEVIVMVGALAGGLQLVDQFTKISRKFCKFCKTVRCAKKEMQALAMETSIFSDFLLRFCDLTCHDPKREGISPAGQTAVRCAKKLIDSCGDVLTGLRELLKKVRPLSSRTDTSKVSKVVAHVRWFFDKDSVGCLQAKLSIARASISMFVNLQLLEESRKRVKVDPDPALLERV
jgi:hypothetical protein